MLFVQTLNTNRRAGETERRPLSYTTRVIRIGPVSLSRAIIDACPPACGGDHKLAWQSRNILRLAWASFRTSFLTTNQVQIWLQLHDLSGQWPQGCRPDTSGQRCHIEHFRHLHGCSQHPAIVIRLFHYVRNLADYFPGTSQKVHQRARMDRTFCR